MTVKAQREARLRALPRSRSVLWAMIAMFYVLAPLFHQFSENIDTGLHAVISVSHSYDGSDGNRVVPAHSKVCSTASHCLLPAVLLAGFSGIDASRQRQHFITKLLPDRLFLSFPSPPPKSAWNIG